MSRVLDTSGTNPDSREALRGCLAVMYHYVRPAPAGDAPVLSALSMSRFEEQLDGLAASREIISLDTLLACLDGRRPVPDRTALLTFDDGLIDHFEFVFPALKRRGLSGTFFVQTDPIEHRCLEAAHANHLLLATIEFGELLSAFESALVCEAPGRTLDDFVDCDRAKELYHYETEPRARYKYAVAFGLPVALRDRVLHRLFSERIGSPADYADRWYPTWSQLGEMQAAGMHVGGHSHGHDVYPRLLGRQQKEDAAACAGLLAERLGIRARAFSYPYGRFDRNTIEAVRSAGFSAAMTTESRLNHGLVNRWEIARIDCIHLDLHLPEPQSEIAHAGA